MLQVVLGSGFNRGVARHIRKFLGVGLRETPGCVRVWKKDITKRVETPPPPLGVRLVALNQT